VELPHLGQDLPIRQDARLRVLVRLHDHHESHRRTSLVEAGLSGPSLPSRRTGVREIDTPLIDSSRLAGVRKVFLAAPKDVAWLTTNDKLSIIEGKRSEEHTSELQSRGHLVCRLLIEKKK